ncbi:MAG: hypothetical protein ACRCV0_05005 [Brevinema sp.]
MLLSKYLLCLFFIFPVLSFSQTNNTIRENIKQYFNDWLSQTNTEWAFEIDGKQFSVDSLTYGLNSLSSNIAQLPKDEQKQLKNSYIQTFIDQTTILMTSYEDLLNYEDLDLLLQEFFRQAATQLWLEKELKKNPKAIEPSKKEIDLFFQKNSESLLQRGLSASQIMEYSKQQLQQEKLQEWTQTKLNELKENVQIKINPKIKKQLDL